MSTENKRRVVDLNEQPPKSERPKPIEEPRPPAADDKPEEPKAAAPAAPARKSARALLPIAGDGEVGPDGKTTRKMYQPGDEIPDDMADRLTEKVHYTRGRLPSDGREKVTRFGKEARIAKVTIAGYDPEVAPDAAGNRPRRDFAPGEAVPVDQLVGSVEGTHYE